MGRCYNEMKLKLAYIKNPVTSMTTHPFLSTQQGFDNIYSAISVLINLSADGAYHLETYRRTLKSIQKPNHYREIQSCLGFKPDSFLIHFKTPLLFIFVSSVGSYSNG
jgi:hypothetical protein